jgi:ubiquinone/menaquinone biosynthesis C-methylase UbiE
VTAGADALRRAYDQSAGAWGQGPARVYDELAATLLAHSPHSLTGATVADVGAGRGAATRALLALGARTVAVDVSHEMLRAEPGTRLAADARRLPLRDDAVDAVVAAFSFNHLADPAAAFDEAARVTRPGGVVLASSYASDDDHPVKAAVDEAVRSAGWRPAPWVGEVRAAARQLATVDRALEVVASTKLQGATAQLVAVPFPQLTGAQLVAWRLGMATVAPWIDSLAPAHRADLLADAVDRLGRRPPTLERRMIVITGSVSPP